MLRRSVLLAVALAALASVLVMSAQASGPWADRYIVVLKNAVDTRAVASLHAARYGAGVENVWSSALHGYSAVIPNDRVAALRADENVAYVELDGIATATAQTLPWGIDKIDADTAKGVRTMPVILGERRARLVAQALMIAFYPIVLGAAAVGWIGPWVALVVLGIPRLIEVLKLFGQPKPNVPPHSYVGWPLWFVGQAFIHTRRAGALLILGLLLNAFLPVKLPWL